MGDAEAVFARYRGHEQHADAQDRLWGELARSTLADPAVPFDRHWELYQAVFAERPPEDGPPQAWRPDAATVGRSNLAWLMAATGHGEYRALHAWSAAEHEGFWQKAIERLDVPFATLPERILDDADGPEDPVWLPGARLNAAAMCLRGDPSRPAIVAGGPGVAGVTTWTMGELKDLADRVSHGLGELGLASGDAVALYMPMTPECVAAYLGIVQAGLAVVSIPDSFAAGEVATRLRLGQAKAVVTVDAFQRAGREVPIYTKARDGSDALSVPPRCIVVADKRPDGMRRGDLLWRDFLGGSDAFRPLAVDPYHVSNVLFSSGTTGDPKAIPWTHLTPVKAAVDGHFHQDIHAGDVVAWPTNIGWMMGPWLIYAGLANGAVIALYDGVPTSPDFVRFCNDAGVTMLGLVPSVVRAWRESGAVRPHSLPGVRVFSSTGEASNARDYLYLMSLAGYRAPVIEYCGGTEIGGGHLTGTVVQPASPATFTTAALGLGFVVLDEDGQEVAPGGHGEIFLVPPSVGLSQRLLNKDHHSVYYEGCPAGPRGQLLRRHGDEVEVLHGGWWRAQGRADDTMNLGGIKVGSIELENAMAGHEDVSETAAVSVQPAGGGADRLVVFVVPAPGREADSDGLRAALQARVKERLNPLFRIDDVQVVDGLPRTASNKVMRRELRRRYVEAHPHLEA